MCPSTAPVAIRSKIALAPLTSFVMLAASLVPGRGPVLISRGSPSSASGRTLTIAPASRRSCSDVGSAAHCAAFMPFWRSALTFSCSAADISRREIAISRSRPARCSAASSASLRPAPLGVEQDLLELGLRRHPPTSDDARRTPPRTSHQREDSAIARRALHRLDRRRGRAVDRGPRARRGRRGLGFGRLARGAHESGLTGYGGSGRNGVLVGGSCVARGS